MNEPRIELDEELAKQAERIRAATTAYFAARNRGEFNPPAAINFEPSFLDDPIDATRNYVLRGDGFIPAALRTYGENVPLYLKALPLSLGTINPSLGAIAHENAGPYYKKLDEISHMYTSAKEAKLNETRTPERIAEVEKLREEFAAAEGVAANVKAAYSSLDDMIEHGDWTWGGLFANVFDPVNLASFGVGGIAAKAIGKTLLKTSASSATIKAAQIAAASVGGGTEAAAFNAAFAAAAAPEGEKGDAAIQGAAIGFPLGVAFGAAGGALARGGKIGGDAKAIAEGGATPDGAAAQGATPSQTSPQTQAILEALQNELLNDAEVVSRAESDAAAAAARSREIAAQAMDAGLSVEETARLIDEGAPLTSAEQALTGALNDGAAVETRTAGLRLLPLIRNTIDAGELLPDDIAARVKAAGWSDEAAAAARAAYEAKDITPLEEWVTGKISDASADKINRRRQELNAFPTPIDAITSFQEGRLIDDVNGINARFDYKIVPADEIYPSFITGDGLQFRDGANANNIRNIREDFNAQTHFVPRGGYEGMPLVDRAGNVAIGNHRARAIQTMTDEQYAAYIEGIRREFPEAYKEYERRVAIDPAKTEYFTRDGKLNVEAFRSEAEPFRELDFTIENFHREFPDNRIQTPIGEIYIRDSQFKKMGERNREAFFGLVKPTLDNPLFIVEKGETKHFIKPFVRDDGQIIFHSVAKKNDEGGIYISSNYPIREGYAKGIFRDGKIIYAHTRRLTESSAHSRMRDEIIPDRRLMVVRVLDTDEDTLRRIAKVSNDGRLFGEKEKIIANEAKYAGKLDEMFDPERPSAYLQGESDLKNRLGAAEETQANQAMIGRLNDATPNAIDRYMRDNAGDIGFKQMVYRNAYALYNLRKAAQTLDNGAIDLNVVLPNAIDRMRIAGANARQNAESLAADYIERLTKYGGKDVEGNLITANDLAADILGLAFRRFRAMKDEGAIELSRRIDDLIARANEQRQPNLFDGEIAPMDRIDAALEIYGERNSASLQEAANLVRRQEAAINALTRLTAAENRLIELRSLGVEGEPINAARIARTNAAKDLLLASRKGEVSAALDHREVGDIDLVWGAEGTGRSDGYGLAKIEKFHPEVLDDLQGHLDGMSVVSRTNNRVRLESPTHRAIVGLDYHGQSKTWLLTEFEFNSGASRPINPTQPLLRGEFLSPQTAIDEIIPPTTPKSQVEAAEKAQARLNDATAKLNELRRSGASEAEINGARIERTNAAKDLLLARREGEVSAALDHREVGDIDLVWGAEGTGRSDGYGLSKIAKFHPEALDNLQGYLDGMRVKSRSDNRVRLESPTHEASVRLEFDGESKQWLLTEFEKDESINARLASTTNIGEKSADQAGMTTPAASVEEIIPQNARNNQEAATRLDDGRVVSDDEARLAAKEAMDEIDEARGDPYNAAETERLAAEASEAVSSAIDGFDLVERDGVIRVKPPIIRKNITAAQEKIAKKYGGVWDGERKEFAFADRESAKRFMTDFADECGI